jgi:hypothetical protein
MKALGCLFAASTAIAFAIASLPTTAAPSNSPHPLAVSADGSFLAYGDGTQHLVRVSAKNGQPTDIVDLPVAPVSVSLTRSARFAAFSTLCGGSGLVDFTGSKPVLTWLTETNYLCTQNPDESSSTYRPVAISPDGETVAQYGPVDKVWKIAVSHLPDRKPLFSLPLAEHGVPLHLEFLPGNRYLLVVEAPGQIYHRAGTPWDINYSLWDLQDGSLRNRMAVQELREPTPEALLALSHFSGDAWAVRQASGRQVDEFVRFPLRACSTPDGAPQALSLPGLSDAADTWHWSADSFGRWLAIARTLKTADGPKPFIDIFDVSTQAPGGTKKLLARLPGFDQISAMQAALDGTKIWITLADGRLVHIDLPREALAPKPARIGSFDGVCTPANEDTEARQIDESRPAHVATKIFEIAPEEYVNLKLDCPFVHGPTILGTADGKLVRNFGSHLTLIDPATGQEIRRIDSPENSGICAESLPQKQAYLTAQGDTIALRPWDGPRRQIAVRPGWKIAFAAAGVDSRNGPFVFVNWEARQPGPDGKTPAPISTAYALETGELVAQAAATYCPGEAGNTPVVSCGQWEVKVGDAAVQKYAGKPEFEARIGEYHGLEVHQTDSATGEDRVIFRAGVEADTAKATAAAPESPTSGGKRKKKKKAHMLAAPHFLAGYILNDRLLLGIKGTEARIYDFRNLTLLATLDEQLLDLHTVPLWDEKSATLWVMGRYGRLEGWKVDGLGH